MSVSPNDDADGSDLQSPYGNVNNNRSTPHPQTTPSTAQNVRAQTGAPQPAVTQQSTTGQTGQGQGQGHQTGQGQQRQTQSLSMIDPFALYQQVCRYIHK